MVNQKTRKNSEYLILFVRGVHRKVDSFFWPLPLLRREGRKIYFENLEGEYFLADRKSESFL